MKLVPLGDRVVLKQLEAEETTKDYLETEEYLDNGTKKYRKRKKRIFIAVRQM